MRGYAVIARFLFCLSLTVTIGGVHAASDLNLDLTPAQILTGEADDTLRDLGARAAEEGATLVVTAPSFWHELIGEQITAGAGEAGVDIQYKDTVIEAAWVRSREAQRAAAAEAPAQSAPEPEPEPEPQRTVSAPPPEVPVEQQRPSAASSSAPQAVEPVVDTAAVAEQARLDALNSLREGMRAPQNEAPAESATEVVTDAEPDIEAREPDAEPPAEETQVASNTSDRTTATDARDASPQPVSASPDGFDEDPIAQGGAAPGDTGEAASEPVRIASAEQPERDLEYYRQDLEERANFGRPLRREIALEDIRPGDELFTSGPLVAVVRRSKAGINTYMLTEEVDLSRNGITELQTGRYLVETDLTEEPVEVATVQPVDTVTERDRMQQRYNFGRDIRDDLNVSLLREDDLIYTSENLAVVIRREQVRAKAYWLTGELDLSDDRLRKEGSNKYRVLIDFR